MIVYIVMLIITIFFAYFAVKNKQNKRVYFVFSFLASMPFVIVSAIRYDVGNDFLNRYSQAFTHIANGGYVSTYEYGFYLLNKACTLITHNPQIIFIVTTLIINLIIFYLIFKYSDNPILSILIYFFGAFFFESMNGVRQYVAMSLLLLAFPLVKKNKFILTAILCIIAYFIHNISALVSLTYFILFIYNKIYPKSILIKKSNNKILVFLIIMIIIIFHSYIYNGIIFLLSQISDKYYAYVGSRYDYSDLQKIPLIVNLIVYYYIYFAKRELWKENKMIDEKYSEAYYSDYFIIFQTIATIFVAMTSINILFLRISYLFSIFQIFSIPYYYEKYYKKHKNNPIMYLTLIMIILAFVWINIINEVEKAIPYQTIFDLKQ